ncbi:MAG: tail fiber domain-containing protein, partial [Elusimicrobia bacterium]|nr:tail fiber domain-containing protein [Elusimicrobiota bacterium]
MDLIVENGGYVGIGIADPVTRLHVLGADGDGNEEQIGFIAQEVREIVPEVVSGVEGSMGIAYGHT